MIFVIILAIVVDCIILIINLVRENKWKKRKYFQVTSKLSINEILDPNN